MKCVCLTCRWGVPPGEAASSVVVDRPALPPITITPGSDIGAAAAASAAAPPAAGVAVGILIVSLAPGTAAEPILFEDSAPAFPSTTISAALRVAVGMLRRMSVCWRVLKNQAVGALLVISPAAIRVPACGEITPGVAAPPTLHLLFRSPTTAVSFPCSQPCNGYGGLWESATEAEGESAAAAAAARANDGCPASAMARQEAIFSPQQQ